MNNQILIVLLDSNVPTQTLAERIEEIREMPGVIGVKTIETIEQEMEA